MKKKPASAQELIELGQFYLFNQKYSEAVNQLKAALKIKPDTSAYYLLGLAYEASNQIPEAKEMYRKAIELDPKNKDAVARLDRISTE
jgi:Tfp pilus assembly protein PilF